MKWSYPHKLFSAGVIPKILETNSHLGIQIGLGLKIP